MEGEQGSLDNSEASTLLRWRRCRDPWNTLDEAVAVTDQDFRVPLQELLQNRRRDVEGGGLVAPQCARSLGSRKSVPGSFQFKCLAHWGCRECGLATGSANQTPCAAVRKLRIKLFEIEEIYQTLAPDSNAYRTGLRFHRSSTAPSLHEHVS